MALALDVTVAGESANGYVSVEEVDAYFEANVSFFLYWDEMDEQEKIARIISATRAIDRFPLNDEPYDVYQALEFPRWPDGNEAIPQKVCDATCEMIILQYAEQDSTTGQSQSADKIRKLDVYQTVGIEYAEHKVHETELKEQASGGSIATVKALLRDWLIADSNESGSFDFSREA